jgi:predicted PurR-regulated permease PerM
MTKTPRSVDPSPSELTFNREKIIRIFFFAAFALIAYQLFLLARPFLTALVSAAMLALAAFPVFIPLRRWVRNNNFAALILTVGVFLAAIIPLVWIGWFLLKEADRLLPTAQAYIEKLQGAGPEWYKSKIPGFLQPAAEPVFHFFESMDIQPQEKILKYAGEIGTKITTFGAVAARHFVITLVNIAVFVIALFFAFRDGESFYQWGLSLIPMEEDHKRAVARRAYETFMAVVLGVMVTASAQGLAAMIGFWISGVRLPVLLGFATIVASFFGASFLVTIPVALSMFQESNGWGIFLLIWGVAVVGFLDNFLKPILIGSRARMPFVLIFFSIVGGVKAYGLLGFVLGPVIVASFLTFVNIYRKGYGTRSEEHISAS